MKIGAIALDVWEDADWSPLHRAIYCKNHNEILGFIRIGAYVTAKDNDFDLTPLHVAARYGTADVAAALIKAGAKPNSRCAYYQTAMHWAAKAHQPDIIRTLKKFGGFINPRDTNGDTLLHLALVPKPELQTLLALFESGADMLIKNQEGIAPIQIGDYALLERLKKMSNETLRTK
ncbi:MAG: ankyrin repeat domain-containing protein [Hyphomonadaceae bacterium]|nr:ankyrin repeat domain-containing protein [Hyphomonadaceae bacterium]MBC6411901.1 ankyrin repeat domain-containing protein [Hyphomonadaceae bacterium]